MGQSRETTVGPRVPGVGVLRDADLDAARAVCAKAPVEAVLAASRIDAAARLGIERCGGELWGYHRDGELVALAWAGANLIPVVPDRDPAAIDALAAIAAGRGRNCSSIVGDAAVVMRRWCRIAAGSGSRRAGWRPSSRPPAARSRPSCRCTSTTTTRRPSPRTTGWGSVGWERTPRSCSEPVCV